MLIRTRFRGRLMSHEHHRPASERGASAERRANVRARQPASKRCLMQGIHDQNGRPHAPRSNNRTDRSGCDSLTGPRSPDYHADRESSDDRQRSPRRPGRRRADIRDKRHLSRRRNRIRHRDTRAPRTDRRHRAHRQGALLQPLADPRDRLPRAVHGRARRHRRQRGAALDPEGPALLVLEPAVGGQRVHADLRRLPAARRARRRPARPQAHVPGRHRGVLGRFAAERAGAVVGDADRRPRASGPRWRAPLPRRPVDHHHDVHRSQ